MFKIFSANCHGRPVKRILDFERKLQLDAVIANLLMKEKLLIAKSAIIYPVPLGTGFFVQKKTEAALPSFLL
ncbi:hypothetical protein [Lactobacillus porci]|uniref:hypothetical protein n=1 Tax=Lactobacillus porci TaxID=2012477 RepID=UPI0039924CCC